MSQRDVEVVAKHGRRGRLISRLDDGKIVLFDSTHPLSRQIRAYCILRPRKTEKAVNMFR
ncbi:MAG: hypothetical protein ACE5Z5_12700 [Candidatus Bathyarchaeia archaeon]